MVNIPVRVDRSDERRLPVQLADGVRDLIASGVLGPGDALPSTRSTARRLSVSRGTVTAAFDQLQAEGYLVAAHGSGTRVNPDLEKLHAEHRPRPAPPVAQPPAVVDLRPGIPDTSTLADPAWRGAWREQVSRPGVVPADPLGDPGLRLEICDHLRRMRGLVTSPDRIAVTAGSREGLAALLRVWDRDRPLGIGVESPGYPSLRRVPTALGHRTVDLPTDAGGLRTADLPESGLDAVLVTPSHQYPYGGSLAAPRRLELVAWARDHGVWLIEDDFDSELRHVGQPLPALAALAPDSTVLLGTFSSVLTPSLACGYVVLPTTLVAPVRRLREALGQPVGGLVQGALARYMATGALRRRTQRLRQIYRRRRGLVMEVLGGLPGSRLQPINGGLQAVLVCSADEDALVDGCTAAGVGVVPLSAYWGGQGAGSGLVVGFGAHDDATLVTCLEQVAAVVRELSRVGLSGSSPESG
ncbi:HTH-type transcriptional regulatory protein GabR [Acidipropionibacterium virtanenii]|uniref:HTH-type transcriptional regulatory protein GabR n=1 Tax=Acidipropionibacterium virtanenii TaxID=2057246 RepID=A0A344UUS1_9ACTN|nr:HTH-type transcriptional regulatory protein GabR [Acidipropionibacterium virtanenii]